VVTPPKPLESQSTSCYIQPVNNLYALFEQLKSVDDDWVVVQHEPETARYGRARRRLRRLRNEAVFLGFRTLDDSSRVFEVAVFLVAGRGRGPGEYACFRCFHAASRLLSAVLFSYYDGTENSPVINNEEAAVSFARQNGFWKP